jgi:hypothetical protein
MVWRTFLPTDESVFFYNFVCVDCVGSYMDVNVFYKNIIIYFSVM